MQLGLNPTRRNIEKNCNYVVNCIYEHLVTKEYNEE